MIPLLPTSFVKQFQKLVTGYSGIVEWEWELNVKMSKLIIYEPEPRRLLQ